MTSKPFEFPVEPVLDKNPPRQMQKLTVLRDMNHLMNAVNELQARVESIERITEGAFTEIRDAITSLEEWTDKNRSLASVQARNEAIQEETEKDA